MKTFVFLFLSIVIIIGSISRVSAAGSVNMSANVVERKVTDTINDFKYTMVGDQPQVLGISTERNDLMCLKGETGSPSVTVWQKIINIFHL